MFVTPSVDVVDFKSCKRKLCETLDYKALRLPKLNACTHFFRKSR